MKTVKTLFFYFSSIMMTEGLFCSNDRLATLHNPLMLMLHKSMQKLLNFFIYHNDEILLERVR